MKLETQDKHFFPENDYIFETFICIDLTYLKESNHQIAITFNAFY